MRNLARDVAVLYSKMLVDHFFDFDKAQTPVEEFRRALHFSTLSTEVVEYLQTLPVWVDLRDRGHW